MSSIRQVGDFNGTVRSADDRGAAMVLGSLAVFAIATAATVRASDGCALLHNGDFEEGLTGWTIEVTDEAFAGDAFASATASFFDGSGYGDPPLFDAHTLAISAYAFSGLNALPGEAVVEIVASTTAVVEEQYLRVKRGGGFEFQFQGTVGRELRVWFEAEADDGRMARTTIYNSLAGLDDGCFPGLSVLGTFDATEPRMQVDLAAAGILPGEVVTVRIGVRVAAETRADCQFVINEAFLIVDRFETCATRLSRGDLNCDGAVDFFDIDAFLLALFDGVGYAAAHPFCNVLNGDVNDDGGVDFFDIDPFLACLFEACP